MIYYIAVIENGQIKTLKLSTGDNPSEGLQEDGTTIVHIDFSIEDRLQFIKTRYWDDEWKVRDAAPNKYSRWNGSSWDWDLEDVMVDVRNVRNNLLYRCDWTQMSDSPLPEEKKSEWQTYRQTLRDLSFVSSDISNVSDVNWPTQPE